MNLFLGEIPGTQSDTRGTNAIQKGTNFLITRTKCNKKTVGGAHQREGEERKKNREQRVEIVCLGHHVALDVKWAKWNNIKSNEIKEAYKTSRVF